MALTEIEKVRLTVGDTETSFFYPILTDEEYEYFLEISNDDVMSASIKAAHAIMFQLSTIPSREKTGEIEVWNDNVKNYLANLKLFLSNPSVYSVIPKGLTPYAAGISKQDWADSLADCDVIRDKLVTTVQQQENTCLEDCSCVLTNQC
jgi:hypothetical protein